MSETRWAKKVPRQARARFTFNAIVEATVQLLAQNGTLTTNSIAERAGVSIGTVYQYFDDKFSILSVVGERLVEATAATVTTQAWMLANQEEDLWTGILKFSRAAVERRRQPIFQSLIQLVNQHEQGREFINAYLSQLDSVLQRLVLIKSEITAPPMTISMLIRGFYSALEYACRETDWLETPEGREQVAYELAMMLYCPLSADRD